MTPTAAALKAISEPDRPVRFRTDDRKRVVRALDVATSRIVAEFPLRLGVDGATVTAKIIGLLLDAGCEIAGVDGEDTEAALTLPEGVEL